jgi:hypothetical protein
LQQHADRSIFPHGCGSDEYGLTFALFLFEEFELLFSMIGVSGAYSTSFSKFSWSSGTLARFILNNAGAEHVRNSISAIIANTRPPSQLVAMKAFAVTQQHVL